MRGLGELARGFVLAAATGGLLVSPALSQTQGGSITTMLRADPKGLVLAFPSGGDTQLISAKIYEGLLNYSTDLKPQPSLARSWEVSPDNRTYTFKLQPGVKWNDGVPFTSADVVFTLSEMLPATSSNAKRALEEVESVEAPDAETVVIKLERPVPYFLMQFPRQQMPMMPKHIYAGTDYLKNPANATPVGTGPFKLDEWRRGSFIRLARNKHYWQKGLPYLDSITCRIIPDASARAIALETGDVQVGTSRELGMSDIERFRSNPDFELNAQGWEYYSTQAMLEINHRRPRLDDVRFRRALYHAIDRQFILDKVWHGLGKIATGPISSTIPFYTPDVPRYDFDPAKARALLDEMGLKADASGMRRDANGKPIKISLLVLPGVPYDRLAEYVREAWKGIGIETDLALVDLGNWYDRLGNWDYDVAIVTLGQLADPGIGSQSYYHSDNIVKGNWSANASGYSNPDVDKWYDAAAVQMDPAKRGELYAQIQKRLVEDAAEIWLLDLDTLTVSDKRVRNLVTDGFGPRGPWTEAYIAK